MISTKLHSCINTSNIRNTFHLNECCFVNHWDKDTVYYKTGSLIYLYRSLTDFLRNLLNCINGLLGSVHTCDNLNQLHAVSGVPVPCRLAELKGKARRFDKTVEKQAMEQAVLDFLK